MSTPNPISTVSGQSGAQNYGFVDPSGASASIGNALYGTGGAVTGGPLGTYNSNVNPVLGQVAGLSGPLQQTLSGLANYQANNALNSVASNFANQGGLGSGAAAQAFGQAIANPFAQAQAQLQQGQLQAGSSALGNLMNISSSAYNTGLNQAGNYMEHASGLVAPTYYTNPAYTASQQGKQTGTALGTQLGGSLLSPSIAGGGSQIANALGLGGAGKGAATAAGGTSALGDAAALATFA